MAIKNYISKAYQSVQISYTYKLTFIKGKGTNLKNLVFVLEFIIQ